MKTVVITGSAKGLGFEMIKEFKRNDYNVVMCDILEEALMASKRIVEKLGTNSNVLAVVCDVTSEQDITNVIQQAIKKFGSIDIWINNAGVNQPQLPIWEVETSHITRLVDIDLKATMVASKLIVEQMIKQGNGQVYNVEGHGSNDNVILGLSIYGTAKRAVTYFTQALAKELEEKKLPIQVGKISPGIMITDFVQNAMINQRIELDEKTKKVYNILGDYPDIIAKFMVENIMSNTKNNVKFEWLTSKKAFLRFMTAGFNKRDFFVSNAIESKDAKSDNTL